MLPVRTARCVPFPISHATTMRIHHYCLVGLFAVALAGLTAAPAEAQQQVCYLVADDADPDGTDLEGRPDELTSILGGVESSIGLTGTERIEAIAIDNTTGTVYAADQILGQDGSFGTLDTATGVYTEISQIGCGNGVQGLQCFKDIDGLSFDPTTGDLYGSVRRNGDDVQDLLIQIDPSTGMYVPGAFGGDDYVVVSTLADPIQRDDIDDLAFDANGTLYAILNEGITGIGDRLVTVDPATGVPTLVGEVFFMGEGQRDLEGLAFSALGKLLAVQGGTFKRVFELDLDNIVPGDPPQVPATLFAELVEGSDYESIACAIESGGGGCTYTQGFWKNHPDAWPVNNLTLGTVNYTQAELLQIFRQPVRGNGLVALAHQLIAAKLNVANGADPTDAQDAIDDADALIGGLVVPPIGDGYLRPRDASDLVETLDDYNNGRIGPGHCDDLGDVAADATTLGVASHAVSPNPFEARTTISYTIAEASEVHVSVFDLMGRRVALLAAEYQEAGTHRVSFDPAGLASGVYVYRIQTPQGVATGRLTLLR